MIQFEESGFKLGWFTVFHRFKLSSKGRRIIFDKSMQWSSWDYSHRDIGFAIVNVIITWLCDYSISYLLSVRCGASVSGACLIWLQVLLIHWGSKHSVHQSFIRLLYIFQHSNYNCIQTQDGYTYDKNKWDEATQCWHIWLLVDWLHLS